MTLDQLMAVFAGLCVLTLLVVAWPVLMGLWPMLAIALLHLFAVGWCFRSAWRDNWAREIFRIDDDALIVDHFSAKHRITNKWSVAWTRLVREQGKFGEIHLVLMGQGKRQEIGAFLPTGERERLARMLERALRPQMTWSSAKPIQVS